MDRRAIVAFRDDFVAIVEFYEDADISDSAFLGSGGWVTIRKANVNAEECGGYDEDGEGFEKEFHEFSAFGVLDFLDFLDDEALDLVFVLLSFGCLSVGALSGVLRLLRMK